MIYCTTTANRDLHRTCRVGAERPFPSMCFVHCAFVFHYCDILLSLGRYVSALCGQICHRGILKVLVNS